MKTTPATRCGVLGGQDERVAHVAPGHHDCPLHADRVQDGHGVAGDLGAGVGGVVTGAVGAPVAARVEGDHAAVAGQVGDLALPGARVDDLVGRWEQERGLALPVALPEDTDAVALDVAFLVGVAGAGLLMRRQHRRHFASLEATHELAPQQLQPFSY
jgi:hypothetical protein